MRHKDSTMSTLLKDKSKMYYSLNFDKVESSTDGYDFSDVVFGRNSCFFGQLMEDGHIFNPYIHRRFLPARFKQMCMYGNNVKQSIALYSWSYVFKVMRDEVHKLALLEKADRVAFEERSAIFTVSDIKITIFHYLQAWETHRSLSLPASLNKKRNSLIYCLTYGQLDTWMKDVPLEIKKGLSSLKCSHDIFTEDYVKAGAYYSIKNEIMFNHAELKGLRGMEACKELKTMLLSGTDASTFEKIAREMWGYMG